MGRVSRLGSQTEQICSRIRFCYFGRLVFIGPWNFYVVLSQKTTVITVMATRLRNKKAKPRRNDSEEGGGGNSLAKRSSRRHYPIKSRRKVIVEEADVVDLWLTVGAAKELTTDADIARFLLSL